MSARVYDQVGNKKVFWISNISWKAPLVGCTLTSMYTVNILQVYGLSGKETTWFDKEIASSMHLEYAFGVCIWNNLTCETK